ncbi:hypothetical protein [Amorphus sp. MBR-141]
MELLGAVIIIAIVGWAANWRPSDGPIVVFALLAMGIGLIWCLGVVRTGLALVTANRPAQKSSRWYGLSALLVGLGFAAADVAAGLWFLGAFTDFFNG